MTDMPAGIDPVPPPPELVHALTVVLELDHATGSLRTPVMSSRLAYGHIGVKGGWFRGKDLSGVLIAGGGDWPTIRDDGVVSFDASYFLRAQDGTIIRLHNRGLRFTGGPGDAPDESWVPGAPRAFAETDGVYFRTTPQFDVEPGPHAWLSRTVFVGVGARTPTGNRIDYYAVT